MPLRGLPFFLCRPGGPTEGVEEMAHARVRKGARTTSPSSGARRHKYVYAFANGKAEGSSALRHLLGGKGCELAEMTNLGVTVPPGFTITTEAWAAYSAGGRKHPAGLWEQVLASLARLEAAVALKLGDPARPLLVSVRSGARASMPGMMDTVLNLGLNDRTVLGLARWTKNERFAWDCYRRFIQMYGQVVLGIEHHHFEELIENHKIEVGAVLDTELGAEDWQALVAGFKEVVLA